MLPFPTLFNTNIAPKVDAEYDRFFETYVQPRIANGTAPTLASNLTINSTGQNKTYSFKLTAVTGKMVGSPWGYNRTVGTESTIIRMLQHAYPTYNSFLRACERQDFIIFTTGAVTSTSSYVAVNRNNYQSLAVNGNYGTGGPVRSITNFIFYDPETYSVKQSYLYNKAAPVYNFFDF